MALRDQVISAADLPARLAALPSSTGDTSGISKEYLIGWDAAVPSAIPWQQAHLAALDLEGTGAQDRDDEAILEIAVVPITDGQPDLASAYCTLVHPERAVPRQPWVSPGLTTAALAHAPIITDIEPELARRLDGAFIVGHNVGVDWRLLHRRCPSIRPAALIDTLRLARLVYP